MDMLFLMIFLPLLFLGFALSGHDSEPEGEVLDGTEGDDMLQGGAGDDTLNGFDGQDMLSGEGGNDVLWAGAGDDGSLQEATDMTAEEIEDLIFGGDTAALQSFISSHTSFGADGGTGNDYVNSGPGNDVLTGGAGDDIVRGSSGHDFLIDLEGSNILNGGFGNDDLWGFDAAGADAPDLLQGWNGDDDLLGDDGDTMEGGEGVDAFYTVWRPGDAPVTITDFDPATEFLQINTSDLPDDPVLRLVDLAEDVGMAVMLNGETMAVLQGVTAAQFHLEGHAVENIELVDRVGDETYAPELAGPGDTELAGSDEPYYFGGSVNDRIVTGDADDRIFGASGDDTLFGGDGQDTLQGDGGNDTLWLGEGDDGDAPALDDAGNAELRETLVSGDTRALESFFFENTYIGGSGGTGDDYINGGAGDDVMNGGEGNDILRGSSGHDFLYDLQGANTLHGGTGDDELWALDPANTYAPDLLQGWDGNDLLVGDDGDTMEGGEGEDDFVAHWFSGVDPVVVGDLDPATESLVILTNIVPAGSVLTLADQSVDIGTTVSLNGETVAVLRGVTAAQLRAFGGSVSLLAKNGTVLLPA